VNQAILINDDMAWNPDKECIQFSAICAGAIVNCQLSKQYLIKKGMETTNRSDEILKYCELISFDIEEDAQQAIDAELHLDQNVLILS